MHCPALATHSTSLTLNLIACLEHHGGNPSTTCGSDIEPHFNWIKSLLRSLPYLRKICVRLDLVSTFCVSAVLESAMLLGALPKFADLKIVGSTSLDSIGSAEDSVLLATWTKQHGLQVDHEAIARYRKRQAEITTAA
jgi:hypothetical protein